MRTIVIACALLLLGACHTSRRVATAEESHTRVHAVRTLRLDSSALFAIVEIDSPRLTLSPDTARPRIALSGRRMRAAVARTAVAVEAAEITVGAPHQQLRGLILRLCAAGAGRRRRAARGGLVGSGARRRSPYSPIMARNSSSPMTGMPSFCAFSSLAGPMFAPAST